MKIFSLLVFAFLIKANGFAQQPAPSLPQQLAQPLVQQYSPTDLGSTVSFTIKNFGFAVDGHFTGLQGKIGFAQDRLADAVFDVSVDAASVNTDNNMRDGHLKNEDYFDVQHYPRIRIQSTSVTKGEKGYFILWGKLTIKNKTKDIDFPFLVTSLGNDYIFKGQFTINRSDFGIGGSSTISNNLTIFLTVLAKKT